MAKREVSEKKKNRKWSLLQGAALGGTAALLVMGVLFYTSVFRENKTDRETKQEAVAKAEIEAVPKEEALAPGDNGGAEDNRKVIKIVEVVPHQICSAFPYLVDWGTQEDYDENLLIGYEGMRYIMFENADGHIGGSKDRITRDGEPEKMDELYRYDIEFTNAYQEWVGYEKRTYWRRYEGNNNILDVNGYFEYVGQGKGLYDINLSAIVEKDDKNQYGIRYEMTAMDRKGSENPKGEYTVNQPYCFVAKEHLPDKNPNPDKIKQWTEYNYNLSFDCTSGADKDYRIDRVTAKGAGLASLSYEYEAYLAEGITWNHGYSYQKEGNYQITGMVPKTASAWGDDYTGLYLRIESSQNKDGTAGVPAGYFKQYDAVADNGKITGDTILYQLTFSKSTGSGSYVLAEAGVEAEIIKGKGDGSVYSEILFDYVGEGKGNYDISFLYAPAGSGSSVYKGTRYAASVEEVCFKTGRYAYGSSAEKSEELYVQGSGDYSKLVTSIDCKGIDYDVSSGGKTSDSGAPAGVSMGLAEGSNNERGSWIFHSAKEEEVNGITKVENISTNNRIYVYGQNRKKCYYEHNRFSNNEWFKLLVYLNNEAGTEPLAWQDYQNGSLTAKEIKEKYREEIEAFDRTYRIEIVQRKPSELTAEEVEEATLIYFSEREGLSGMANDNGKRWNYINDNFRGGSLEPFYSEQENLVYQDDISAEALMAIYRCCMYEQTTALMLDMDRMAHRYIKDGKYAEKNLGKMVMMLDLLDYPSDFADFIDGYEEKNEDYSIINPDTGEITVYENKQGVYNCGKYYLEWTKGDVNAGNEIEPRTETVWDENYFRVFRLIQHDNYLQEVYETPSPINGWEDAFPLSGHTFYDKNVEDDWTWYAPNYSTGVFNEYSKILNIWKILHNRNSKETSEPVVVVTNADGIEIPELANVLTTYFFYADAYSIEADSDFKIDFKVNWIPEEVTEPNPLQSLQVTRENGSVVYTVDNPQYKTEYTCNVVADFMKNGDLNPDITVKDYTITATDTEGKVNQVIVRFILREAFLLN